MGTRKGQTRKTARKAYTGKKRKSTKKKSTVKKHKALSAAQVQKFAKAYAKSRSKKRWPMLMKKHGLKQAQRVVKASKKYAKKNKIIAPRGSRKSLRPVPQMRQVSGQRTPPFVFPQRKAFPIGTLAYAKKAIDRLSWPNEGKNAKDVMIAVKKRYPHYDWPSYWNDLKKRAKLSRQLKTWSQYTR